MSSCWVIASRLALTMLAFGFIGFGFIPLLDALERWARRRHPEPRSTPCTVWWCIPWNIPAITSHAPPYAIAIACRPSQYGDPTRHRCQRRIK